MENIDLGIILIDAEFNIVMMNAAEGKLLKRPASELVGKKCFREIEKRDAVCPHCPGIRAKATGQPVEFTNEVVSRGGNRIYTRLQAFPICNQDGTATGFIEVVEDITESKQVERDLRESRLHYRTLFENTPVGIGMATLDGLILAGNKAMHQKAGYSEADMGKLHVSDIYANPKERKLILRRLLRRWRGRWCSTSFRTTSTRRSAPPVGFAVAIARWRLSVERRKSHIPLTSSYASNAVCATTCASSMQLSCVP